MRDYNFEAFCWYRSIMRKIRDDRRKEGSFYGAVKKKVSSLIQACKGKKVK